MDSLAALLPTLTPALANLESARRQRADRCRKVLDAAKLGKPHTVPAPEALAAAKELLDLGFPYAFELTPEELLAVREVEWNRHALFTAASIFAVPWVVFWGTLNAVGAWAAAEYRPGLGVAIMAGSAFTSIAAGLNVLRLDRSDCDQRQAARRLFGWTLLAAVLFAVDLALGATPGPGLFNAVWIIPFTLPLAIFGWRAEAGRHSSG